MTIEVPMKVEGDTYSDEIQQKLINLMLILHWVYCCEMKDALLEHLSGSNVEDMVEFATNDRPFFTRALVAFGSGMNVEALIAEKDGEKLNSIKLVFGYWVASNMIRRSLVKVPGTLQTLIGSLCAIYRVSRDVHGLITRFRISASWNRLLLRDIVSVYSKRSAGWDMKKSGICYSIVMTTWALVD